MVTPTAGDLLFALSILPRAGTSMGALAHALDTEAEDLVDVLDFLEDAELVDVVTIVRVRPSKAARGDRWPERCKPGRYAASESPGSN
jgi:hypothetical protein